MSEWWTYRLSDFLMFAPRTYYRLFELFNAEIWPLQVALLALGIAVLFLAWRGGGTDGRVVCAVLALVWLFIAWAYHWQRYATINWGAAYYAAGFALEGLLLGIAALRGIAIARPRRALDLVAVLLAFIGVIAYPLVAPLSGRPWTQAELFGVAPDPTAIATLGLLLLTTGRFTGLLMLPPLVWCAMTAATLWTMESPEAVIPGAAGVAALLAALMRRRSSPPAGT